MKAALLTAVLVTLAAGPMLPPPATAQAAPRPRLTIWYSGNAESRQFFHDFEADPDFRRQIKARFDVYVVYVVDVGRCGLWCPRPAYRTPYFRAGTLPIFDGYRGTADFLRRLRIEPVIAHPTPPRTRDEPPARPEKAAPTEPLPPPPDRQRREQTPPPSGDAPAPTAPPAAVHREATQSAGEDAPASSPAPRRSGWLAKWIGRAAVVFKPTHPAGQTATLLTLASGALSWIIARKRRRAQPTNCKRCASLEARLNTARDDCRRETQALTRQLEERDRQIEQLEIEREQLTKTETRYVEVPVSDQEGEAFKEACRRVAQTSPKDTPVVRTIEATAQQILHGRGVLRKEKAGREANTANPGLFWRD